MFKIRKYYNTEDIVEDYVSYGANDPHFKLLKSS